MITFDVDQTSWGSIKTYPDGDLQPFTPDGLVIHYGGRDHPTNGVMDEMAKLQEWQRYHIDTKRWFDVAYNFAVGQSGTRYRLRGINRAGATRGDIDEDGIPANEEKIAVVWIGGAQQTPTPEAYAAMAQIVEDVRIEIPGAPVTVHSDYSDTSCPGDDWRQWVDNEGWNTMNPLNANEKAAIDRLTAAGIFTTYTTDDPAELDAPMKLRTLAVILDRLYTRTNTGSIPGISSGSGVTVTGEGFTIAGTITEGTR